MLDATTIATLIAQRDAGPHLDQIAIDLAKDPIPSSTTLKQLLQWRDGSVRFWALGAAEHVFPRDDYIRTLKAAVHDEDEAVRDDAIARLADLAPEELRTFAKSLASRLSREEIPSTEKVFALWTLAKIGTPEAIQQISDLRSSEPDWTQLARVADVVRLYLAEGDRAILNHISNHEDHERMEELCTLAWHVMGTREARAALAAGLERAPDATCRQPCRQALDRLESN